MPIKKSKKSNNSSSFEEIEKKVNKLTARLKVSIFLLLLIALAGGFFIFSSVNFKMVANALMNSYNKTNGSTLTHDEWNNLNSDFLSGTFSSGTGPFCIFMNACPAGWTDKGEGGYIRRTSSASCPYGAGSWLDASGLWSWCHPRVCCKP